ncbi:MAG: PAS domain-containing sensor histidine kinase [Bosea sp.]|nr:PAS domain-containing sensor histidine kinase [Bosea sp. (in: a-proteobacteria)]
MTVSFEPLRRIMDGLVHGRAAEDPLVAARHRSFIAAHLVAGLLALLAIPVWLAVAGFPSPAVAIAFLLLVAPLPIAAFLSRTGSYGIAQLLSSAALATLVAWLAAFTGGMASPALAWLVLVPAEAGLAGSRRVMGAAAGLAVAALAAVLALTALGLPAQLAVQPAFGPAVIAGAVLYAALIAIRVETLHAEASAAARLGDHRYRLLADNATDLITRHLANGDVTFASPAARALAACPPSDLLGQGLFQRVLIGDRPAFLRALSEADRTGETVTAEFRLRVGPEETAGFTWVEMRCRPVVDPTSGRSVVAVTRDINFRKAQEAAFAEASRAAEQANRAKSQFLANMSHELRTPLNAIIGFSDILEQQLFGRFEFERHRDYARLIRSSGEHLLEVVNSILDMSKIEAGRFEIHVEPVPVAGLVESAIEMMSHQIASRHLRLERRIEPGLPDLLADRRACRQILLNLLSNAAKFTEAGGTVMISAREGQGGIVIEVADTGIGISADDLPRLGTPFVQADADINRRYEGTGLGLSVVKGLVHLHGGTLAIASKPGEGTTVSVTLPAEAVTRPVERRAAPGGIAYEKERRIA